LERAKTRPVYEVGREEVSVPDMIQFLKHQLTRSRDGQPISATELFEKQRSRRAMICLFLAILELVRWRSVELTQGEAFGDIGLRPGAGFSDIDENAEELAAVESAQAGAGRESLVQPSPLEEEYH
jgi:segregation and condensation protein A